jgi:high-affinity nickel-transport protein
MLAATMSALGVGFALGLKHALEADHLAAVAVIVGEKRRGIRGSTSIGLSWGMGHAAALTTVSLAVILLGLRIPGSLALWMEFLVGVALALLGARMLWRCRGGAVLHAHAHDHGPRSHFHPHVHSPGVDPEHASHHALPAPARELAAAAGRAPFLVGLLHGMAGSAALTVILLTTIPATPARVGYLAMFGLGSILGMTMMSVLVGLPFASGRLSGPRPQWVLRILAGSVSLGLGLLFMVVIGPEILL